MIAGVIAAVSTYAMQSITYLNPLRGSMSAETLRSSHRSRNHLATSVIDDPVNGRTRIVVIQLQGHLFFGNLAQLNSGIQKLLKVEHTPKKPRRRRIVILDFSLVVGIDSSAAQGLIKLKNTMLKKYGTGVCIFVPGSEQGFPCEFDLSNELTSGPCKRHHQSESNKEKEKSGKHGKQGADSTYAAAAEAISEATSLLQASSGKTGSVLDEEHQELMDFNGSFVLESLDLALIFAENCLIAWSDPSLLDDYDPRTSVIDHFRPAWREHSQYRSTMITDAMLNASHPSMQFSGEDEEKELALRYLMNMVADCNVNQQDMQLLLSHFERETYTKEEFIWKQNDASNSAKILVGGRLIALLENEAGTSEVIFSGNLIGELGLVQGIPRMSSVQCISDEGAILYSLHRQSYEKLVKNAPHIARHIDMICISYLANRVQHVSNRIFETRCLPI